MNYLSMLSGLALLALKRLLLCATFAFGGMASAEPEEPPPPQTILDRLPPLPPPTEQQLQRGRELLDKIVHVVENVPLTDAAAVLKVFGFIDLYIEEYPTHTWVGPRGTSSHFAQPKELVGTGFSDISVQPRINTHRDNAVARLSARINPGEACLSIDNTRQIFLKRALRVDSDHVFVAGFVERPRRVHRTDELTFTLPRISFSETPVIGFRFEYQTCAISFGFIYRAPAKEVTK